MARVYMFKRFERFWHWAQAGLVLFLLLTGFEIHGTYKLFGWAQAVRFHTTAAWTLIALWLFAIFWHFTTGEWRQYIPTSRNVLAMIDYYLIGIFRHAPHPHRPTPLLKHNPLQRLAYLAIKLVINPLILLSGLAYLYYNELGAVGILGANGMSLQAIALAHTAGAFLMLAFFIAHVYLATAGHTPLAHIKAMITGWEEVEEATGADPKATTSRANQTYSIFRAAEF
jgi:thiosulfate reductase cytochrome b subunit